MLAQARIACTTLETDNDYLFEPALLKQAAEHMLHGLIVFMD
jgi:hypothetical protein